jgi:conjugative transposon protein traA
LASSFAYARTIRDLGLNFGDARIQDLFLLWNKINRSANMAVVDYYTQYAEDESLNLFNARIYHSVRFARELGQGGVKGVFRSSYLPPARALRPSTGIDAWVEETIERLHLNPITV